MCCLTCGLSLFLEEITASQLSRFKPVSRVNVANIDVTLNEHVRSTDISEDSVEATTEDSVEATL